MKTRLLLLALAASLCTGFTALAASPQDEVKAAVDSLRTAIIKKDKAAIDKLVAPDVTYSHSNAKMENKAEMMAALMGPDTVYQSMDMENQTIRIIGKTALVQGKMIIVNTQKGEKKTLPLSVLMVWVKNPAGWQLTARQTTRYL